MITRSPLPTPKLASAPQRQRRDRVGDGTIVDQCRLIATTLFDVEVEGVVASVHLAAGEPAIKRLPALVQHTFPLLVPVDCFRGFAPETGRIVQRPLKRVLHISGSHVILRGNYIPRRQASTTTSWPLDQ